MSTVTDIVKSVVNDVLNDILRKATRTSKRARRRRRPPTASERLRRLERLVKPAKRQTSRKKTVRSRAKTRRRTA